MASDGSGDLLSDINLQNRQFLAVIQACSTRARVKKVDNLSVNVEQLDDNLLGLMFEARWGGLLKATPSHFFGGGKMFIMEIVD